MELSEPRVPCCNLLPTMYMLERGSLQKKKMVYSLNDLEDLLKTLYFFAREK